MSKRGINQKTRMALGLCKYCEKPRAEGKIVCVEHAEERAAVVVAKQHERREKGCCRYCDDPPIEGKTLCQKHTDAKAATYQARVEGRKLRGLCRLCDEKQEPGKALCSRHLAQARAQEAVIRPRLQSKRKAAGTCHDCSEPRLDGKSFCQKHYDMNQEHSGRHETREKRKNYKKTKGRYARCVAMARHKGKEWTLTRDEYDALVVQPCDYCGFEHAMESAGVGLDRLDNGRGYIQGNVVSCCIECNCARGDRFTIEEMKKFVGPAIRTVNLLRKGLLPTEQEMSVLDHFVGAVPA